MLNDVVVTFKCRSTGEKEMQRERTTKTKKIRVSRCVARVLPTHAAPLTAVLYLLTTLEWTVEPIQRCKR